MSFSFELSIKVCLNLNFTSFSRYRLIRHEILMNVNDCLSLEGICNVANEETEEYGCDVTVKNLNQVHHLYKVEATIGDLFVYCDQFALNNGKIYCEKTDFVDSSDI